jgi:hypothetical protein
MVAEAAEAAREKVGDGPFERIVRCIGGSPLTQFRGDSLIKGHIAENPPYRLVGGYSPLRGDSIPWILSEADFVSIMAPPLVSIILPTRNRLATIRRTIDRIMAQTLSNWELIISDNGSDEGGKADYLTSVASNDSRLRLHFQERNIGIHANWKFCIGQVSGRYYIPVTDDDWWGEDHFLETLLSLHDGKTASVFPNMCIHHLDTGEVEERALSPVYAGAVNEIRDL